MTIAIHNREENLKTALSLMLQELGDRAIDTTFFNPAQPPFEGQILRTMWEELARKECVESVGQRQYRLTAKGWRVGLEISGTSQSSAFYERLGRLLATMKRHVKERKDSVVVPLQQLAVESKEPEGWVFNVIDSKASSTGNQRVGASWFGGERGRVIEIPAGFNLQPVDIASALNGQHLERIQELEERLEEVEEDRAQFHCPYCDAPISGVAQQDYPDHHCIVTYESFECGYVTADGNEDVPCPYGPNWPSLDEFEIVTKQEGNMWVCDPVAKTARARRVHIYRQMGRTRNEAEERAKRAAAPKTKDWAARP